MIQATFVMEQHIGHRAFYENLRSVLDAMPQLQAQWVEVTYRSEQSRWTRVPLSPHLRGSLIGREQVRQGLGRNAMDVAVFNTQVPAVLGGRLVKGQPYVLCTDITPLQYDAMAEQYGHRQERNPLLRWYKHQVNVRVMQGAARILPWSQWAAKSIIDDYGVDAGRVEVLAPGVDLTMWQPAPIAVERAMRILFVGGDFHRKGGDDLLAAFRALPPGSTELILVTRTKLPPEPGVFVYNELRPNTPELLALYQSCDLFVLPTKAEAFGIAAVEASATGLPVVATRVGGLSEIVVEGETGLLIEPGDVGALTTHLKLLAENRDLRRQLGQGARKHAERHFDAKANAARLAALLQQIVSAIDRA